MDIIQVIKHEEGSGHRFVLVHDDFTDAPYDDGSFPIIFRPHGEASRTAQVDITSFKLPDPLLRAWAFRAWESNIFERFAAMFYGSTTFAYLRTREGLYVALDTADWREAMGISPDQELKASLGEYQHWLDGEVYTVVEQCLCSFNGWHTINSFGPVYGSSDDTLQYALAELAEEGA